MKKRLLKLSVLFVALFIGVIGANALTIVNQNCTFNDAGSTNATCELKVTVDAGEEIKTGDVVKITVKEPNHIENNLVTILAATGWTVVDDGEKPSITIDITNEKTVELKYTGTDTITAATIKLADGNYTKDDAYAESCGFKYGLKAPACSFEEREGIKYYFGLEGRYLGNDEAAENQYYKECFSCKTPETSEDGKYHGLDGKETDQATYEKECTNICKIEDDKYYCQDGAECTKEEYENECAKNEKQGSFLPYAGIAAGIALIGVSTILVKKQTKLRKI